MLDTLPLLLKIDFPPLLRAPLKILQVNLGYRCNQSCMHCHVDAGPKRTEMMDEQTIDQVLAFARRQGVQVLDLTGGAPELNPHFRRLVSQAVDAGLQVLDRCNLTILEEPEQADLAGFLAAHRVEVIASLPCYLKDNVERQRGKGVFQSSLDGLRRLNALGYAEPDSGLSLNLVYNPQGPVLPPSQCTLEQDYRRQLLNHYGIRFNQLYTLANMPIRRFGSMLLSKNRFQDYMGLLRDNHRPENLDGVMCRSLLSVDWRGYLYDCDFNQMLGMQLDGGSHIADWLNRPFDVRDIRVAGHCYGCTAGQGSSCGGALE